MWRYFTGSRDDGHHFSDASLWTESTIEITVTSYPHSANQPVQLYSPGGTGFLKFTNVGVQWLNFTFEGENGFDWGSSIIGYKTEGPSIETDFPLVNGSGSLSYPWFDEDHLVLVPVVTDMQDNDAITYHYEAEIDPLPLFVVDFFNQIKDENAGGELLLDGSEVIQSGERRFYNSAATHSIETLSERFVTDSIYKHNNWKFIPAKFKLIDYFQPASYLYQNAVFIAVHPALIRNSLISAGGIHGGEFDFRDPWYVHSDGIQHDTFLTYDEPYQPTGHYNETEGGVFLDQDPAQNMTHYSVRVPQTQTTPFHGQNITWHFQGWEGEEVAFEDAEALQTAVIFRDGNAEARALYKGHLASNNSGATAHNNGRRVVRDGDGTLHAVYEDSKEIWYTYSTDGGESWAEETWIGGYLDTEDENFYPAIAENNGILHVAYTTLYYDEGELVHAAVNYKEKPVSGGEWMEMSVVGVNVSEVTFIPKPAIEIWEKIPTSDEYVIITFNRVNEPSQIATYYKEIEESNFHSLDDISGSDPSLGTDAGNLNLYLTYTSGGEIYIRQWHQGQYWQAGALLSGEPWWLSWNRYSNVTIYGGTDFACRDVWTAQDEVRNPIVAYRTFRYPSQLGEFTYFYSGQNPAHPTVAVDETWGKITIFFEEDGDIIRRQKSGDYWTEKTYGAGWYPNIAGHGEYGAIWAKESSAPYRIQSDYTIPESPLEGGDPLAEDTLVINKRLDFTFMQDTTIGHLTLHLENLDAGSRWLQFNNQLHTRQITIPPNAAARFNLRCRFHNLTFPVDTMTVLFNISFDEGNVVRLLGTLRVKDLLAFNTGQYHNIPQTIPMGFLAGKRGRLKLSFGENLPVISDVVVRRDSGEVRISLGKAGGENEPSPAAIPTEFKLHQNYPNPFNPATTISFDLPDDAPVNLQIYDITGRRVRSLADHPFSAGVHQVVWDGRDERGAPVSSGIYVYRLSAYGISQAGIEAGKFVENRKMVLMR